MAINQLCVLDNLIHFSSVVRAVRHAQNRSVGTKLAINLPPFAPRPASPPPSNLPNILYIKQC